MFISTYLPTYPAVPAGPNVPRIHRANYETLWKGAMFNSHPKEGETPSFKGSAMMVLAENEGEVRKILENDIYSRSGVWDLENMQIIPVCFLFFSFLSFWYWDVIWGLCMANGLWNSLNRLWGLVCKVIYWLIGMHACYWIHGYVCMYGNCMYVMSHGRECTIMIMIKLSTASTWAWAWPRPPCVAGSFQ